MKIPHYHTELPEELRDTLSAEEQAAFETIWREAGCLVEDEPTLEEYRAMGQSIWYNLSRAMRPRIYRLSRWQRVTALAACITMLIAVGVAMVQQPTRIHAPLGEQVTEVLPDGTTVTLNSGSRVSYAKRYGDSSRELRLHRGEVFLDVVPSESPFKISSFDANVEVLGTAFNVRAWPNEPSAATQVTVVRGRVRLAPRSAPEFARELTAGQTGQVQGAGPLAVVREADSPEEAVAWILGGFKYTSEQLGVVAAAIERRYDVTITITSPELASLPIGIYKQNPENAEAIIRDICALNCAYSVTPDGFELSAR